MATKCLPFTLYLQGNSFLIIILTISQICEWAGTKVLQVPVERKFVEGERVLKAGHTIRCGKNVESDGKVSFTALCLQTSNIRLTSHEIKGDVNSKGILSCICSYKAGLGEKCKHIIAVLLYCYQNSNKIEVLSCTDKECEWRKKHKKVLQNYNPAPLLQHEYFSPSQPPQKIKIVKSALKLIGEKDKEREETEEEIKESLKKHDACHTKAKRKKEVLALSLV
ncbi:uncharacterized protein [Mycetomoellerius zeteki]|uniref:uncharacterized protein n=1 Tax=Mycetomoellerius zeteki TaxID=64791 RepID=UPI00084E5495|nr:PREDICTED: uncharacterized protein LOC108730274 [Trachymyrmex zeteki]